MYLCYIDESGTSEIPGNTSHFVLAGLSIPIQDWKTCDREIDGIKRKFGLQESEIHIAWMMRPYLEQSRIPDFEKLDWKQRVSQVRGYRISEILRLQRVANPQLLKQTKKNFKQTGNYCHLTLVERNQFIKEIASAISKWSHARLFAECVDKRHFDPTRTQHSVAEQSFEQLVSRFEQYLRMIGKNSPTSYYGLLIHDNNETIAKKHTALMN